MPFIIAGKIYAFARPPNFSQTDQPILSMKILMRANSAQAAAHFDRMPKALQVASPLLFEFKQSVR